MDKLDHRLIDRLKDDFGLTPVTAAELEFYVIGGDVTALQEAVFRRLMLEKWERERGHGQFEIALPPVADAARTAEDLVLAKRIIVEEASAVGGKADFSAKPFADQPGSALHIHIHLADETGRNVFYKDDSRMSDALRWSLGGLLARLPETMPVFAPTPESYARFSEKTHVPTTISWGANNRTTALRLPDSAHDRKRIEHRVAGADADPYRVMVVILEAIHYGMANRCDPGKQTYGDANLPGSGLTKLPLLPCLRCDD